MPIETSLTLPELVVEVRDALAALDDKKIPDETIVQQYQRFVLPKTQDILENKSPTQAQVDAVLIAWTAEKSFKSWLAKETQMFGDVQVGIDPEQYASQLEERTNEALETADVQRDLTGGPVAFVDRTSGMLRD